MRTSLATILIALILAGTARGQTTAPTTSPSYPESNEGLEQEFKDILAASAAHDAQKVLAMTRSLVLKDPQAWFKDVFGEEKGTKLATAYQKESTAFPEALLFSWRFNSPSSNLAKDLIPAGRQWQCGIFSKSISASGVAHRRRKHNVHPCSHSGTQRDSCGGGFLSSPPNGLLRKMGAGS